MRFVFMRVLEFDVEKQILKKNSACDFGNIVAGSKGYLKVKFHFLSDDWDGCKKVVRFWGVNALGISTEHVRPVLLDEDDSCMIPASVLVHRRFGLSVIGAKDSHYFLSTNNITVKQEVN